MKKFIPVNIPFINGEEKKYLAECIRSKWVSSEGPFVKEFEEKFAYKVNRKYGIAVANGTGALEIAVKTLDLEPGDEIIMPTFTIISCLLAVLRSGAKPVLIDADPFTYNMDVSQIEKKITKKTKAIMVVHIYGLPVDMDPVMKIAKKYKLKIIEDAAEAHGLFYKDKPCGSFGNVSIFSFYPNKLITTGEGGMVLTDRLKVSKRCKSLRNLCFKEGRRFIHEELGWNYRMTNIQAALGLAQLKNWDKFILKKREIGEIYNQAFKDIRIFQLPVKKTNYAENIYWVYPVVIKKNKKISVSKLMTRIEHEGIGIRPFFYPMHKQPVFIKMGLFKNEKYPVAEAISENGFYIPSGLGLTNSDIRTVIKKIKSIINEAYESI